MLPRHPPVCASDLSAAHTAGFYGARSFTHISRVRVHLSHTENADIFARRTCAYLGATGGAVTGMMRTLEREALEQRHRRFDSEHDLPELVKRLAGK